MTLWIVLGACVLLGFVGRAAYASVRSRRKTRAFEDAETRVLPGSRFRPTALRARLAGVGFEPIDTDYGRYSPSDISDMMSSPPPPTTTDPCAEAPATSHDVFSTSDCSSFDGGGHHH